MPIHLTIHGHFYQPPRENPWSGAVERQQSAAPFHDWNARITAECYRPNATSRLLDAAGRIQEIVNNYERLSFNFGPTLLSWLAREEPDLPAVLRLADRRSLAALGRGNAIAQAYNHPILPLASPRDRRSQIVWGLADFRARFGRPADAMWLPETAVDEATLRLLVQAGMRYVILAPSQAARWRPLGDGPWTTPAEAELDPRRPYRWILRDADGRPQGDAGLDVCFYHAPLSRGISFQHYLRDAVFLADRIAEAAGEFPDPLLLIATDGESFGHHEPHGDMCLATLFAREAPRRGFQVTNPAAYLDRHRPGWEVELLPESAWSCCHGVARWQSDCGCSSGGGAGWSQAWRAPLRRGLDRLRDSLERIFTEEGGSLLRDPWAARDEYIELLLDPAPETRAAFLARHRRAPLTPEQEAGALRLLEMQHQAMLMYTSCGWFFADISGIETVQNLRYAARAIELAAPFAPLNLEAVLLEELAQAKSNLSERRDGRHLWRREVRPSRIGAEQAAARWLVDGLLGRPLAPATRYRFDLTPMETARAEGLALARVEVIDRITGERCRLVAVARREPPFDLAVGLGPSPGPESWVDFCAGAREAFAPGRPVPQGWLGRHGMRLLRLRDFPRDERPAVLELLLAEAREAWTGEAAALADRLLPAAEAMVRVGTSLPEWMRRLLEERLSRRMAEALGQPAGLLPPGQFAGLVALTDRARQLGLRLELGAAAAGFGRALVERLEALARGADLAAWQEFLTCLHLASRLSLPLPERALQDRLLPLLRERAPRLLEGLSGPRTEGYALLTILLTVATRLNLDTEEYRARLKPLETSLAEDPALWP